MGRVNKRRDRLLDRMIFKHGDGWSIWDCLFGVLFTKIVIPIFIFFVLFADGLRDVKSTNREDAERVIFTILFFFFYTPGLAIITGFICWKVPEKYFRLCSFLAILHIILIIFLVFNLFQTFVPGPETEKLEEIFKLSLYAAFIWIPALIISLFSCAITLWKASDQSELYTVILDGKRSSTKLMDP